MVYYTNSTTCSCFSLDVSPVISGCDIHVFTWRALISIKLIKLHNDIPITNMYLHFLYWTNSSALTCFSLAESLSCNSWFFSFSTDNASSSISICKRSFQIYMYFLITHTVHIKRVNNCSVHH